VVRIADTVQDLLELCLLEGFRSEGDFHGYLGEGSMSIVGQYL
jgi:hypothetical protein